MLKCNPMIKIVLNAKKGDAAFGNENTFVSILERKKNKVKDLYDKRKTFLFTGCLVECYGHTIYYNALSSSYFGCSTDLYLPRPLFPLTRDQQESTATFQPLSLLVFL